MTEWEAKEKSLSAELWPDRMSPHTTPQQHTEGAGCF